MDRKHQEQYLTELYDQYFSRLFIVAMGFFDYDPRYEPIVTECVQDVFVKATRCYEELVNHPNVGGWLMEACKHRLRNAKRRQISEKKKTAFSIDSSKYLLVEDPGATIDLWINQHDNQALIDEISRILIGKESTVFVDYFQSEMKEKDVAEKNHMTLAGVKATIRRIREKAKRIKPSNMLFFFIWVSLS